MATKLVKTQTVFVTLNNRLFRCTEFIEEIVSVDPTIIDLTSEDDIKPEVIDLTQNEPKPESTPEYSNVTHEVTSDPSATVSA